MQKKTHLRKTTIEEVIKHTLTANGGGLIIVTLASLDTRALSEAAL